MLPEKKSFRQHSIRCVKDSEMRNLWVGDDETHVFVCMCFVLANCVRQQQSEKRIVRK